MDEAAAGISPKRFDLFLSYSNVDSPWAIRLKRGLEERGLAVWLDQDEIRPGDVFGSALEQGLRESRAVALLVSPESLQSGWVQNEYWTALRLTLDGIQPVQVIPVILRDAELPAFLANRSCIDFRDEAMFEQSLDRLIWGATGRKPEGSSARVLKARSLPTSRTPSTTDASIFEGLFVRLLKPEGTFAADLRAVGYDLARPQPCYPNSVLLAALNVAHRHVYPHLTREEAHRLLGMRFANKYFETLLGKMTRNIVIILGIERFLMKTPKIVAYTNPGIDVQVRKLPSGEFRLVMRGDCLAPQFQAGAIEGATLYGIDDAVVAHAGTSAADGAGDAKRITLSVEVVRCDPCEYELSIKLNRPKGTGRSRATRISSVRGQCEAASNCHSP